MGKRKRRRLKMLEEKPPEEALAEAPSVQERPPEEEKLLVEEKPAAPAEAPCVEAPPIKPVVEEKTEEERVHEYLVKHGATKVPRIARDLNLSISVVMNALKGLKKQGKALLC